jgi:hypothetical protein
VLHGFLVVGEVFGLDFVLVKGIICVDIIVSLLEDLDIGLDL